MKSPTKGMEMEDGSKKQEKPPMFVEGRVSIRLCSGFSLRTVFPFGTRRKFCTFFVGLVGAWLRLMFRAFQRMG